MAVLNINLRSHLKISLFFLKCSGTWCGVVINQGIKIPLKEIIILFYLANFSQDLNFHKTLIFIRPKFLQNLNCEGKSLETVSGLEDPM
jgi:hypothetical protein